MMMVADKCDNGLQQVYNFVFIPEISMTAVIFVISISKGKEKENPQK